MIDKINKTFVFLLLLILISFVFLVSANLTLELISPSNLIGSSSVTFNYSVSSDADNCSLYHDVNSWTLIATEYDVVGGYNSFEDIINLEGLFNWNVVCFNNSVSFSAPSNQTFTMDLSAPDVSLLSPSSSSSTHDFPVEFIYQVSDYGVVDNCSLYLNGVLETTQSNVAKDIEQSFLVNLLPNLYNWSVSCFDSFNRFGQSSNYSLQVYGDLIWDVSSFYLGSTHSNGGALSDTTTLTVVNLNDDISLSCSGDCLEISTNFISMSGQNEDFLINFDCSSSTPGFFSASFNASSNDFPQGDILTVSCDVFEAKPDFYVNDSLFYYTGDLIEGEIIQLNLDVHNFGDVDSSDVVVNFYEGDVLIGSDLVNILAQGFATASTNYEIFSGNKTLSAAVNPENLISEYNESNNVAFLDLDISSWQVLTGNVTGRFVLEDGSSNVVYDWPTEIMEGSKLYIVDADSSIDWTSLQALSRDTSGNLRLQDFNLADEFLNISTHYDSLSETFGDSPLTDNFTLFNNLVENVPYFYTHEPDFFTGVVWDYSTDSDGYYGGVDREGLVFFTRLKENVETDLGMVNYQVKFVANLRNYVGESDNVAIYIELI